MSSGARSEAGIGLEWLRRPAARLVERIDPVRLVRPALGGALLLTGALLFYITRHTTFWFDEWLWVVHRRGNSLSTYLDPYNEHLSLVPIAIYKLLFATAGIRDYVPYRVLVIAGHLGCCGLLFVYARRRVGAFLALVAAALILVLGPGWQNILWPFQIAWLMSLAAGVGALMLLERADRPGDLSALLLLLLAIASSSIGVPFASR